MVVQPTPINTVVIGAGQAGLSMSYYLLQHDVDHVVLERARVGERWRAERWDSLRFQFPNRYVRLPGFAYDGDDPTGFMAGSGIVDVLERYASHIAAPVRCGINVRTLGRAASGDFDVVTDNFALRAQNVVLATGPYQRTNVPALSMQMPAHVAQLTASGYTHARALPAGAVVVVGAGGSGVQIAEDLVAAGRTTYLCVGAHRRVPRRFQGRDVMDWLEELGMTSAPVEERREGDHAPLLTGVDGGYDVDLRTLAERGGHLLGRLDGVREGDLLLGDNLPDDIVAGDQSYDQFVSLLQSSLAERGHTDVTIPDPATRDARSLPQAGPRLLNIADAGISTIIWATGYSVDFSWDQCGEYTDDGMPVHNRGISPVPGLYYLGLAFLHNARSSFFWGVGDDAQHIVQHLVSHGGSPGSG